MAVSARRAPVPRLRSCGRLVRTSSTTLVCSWPPHHAWSLGRRGRPGRRNPVTCRSPICGEFVSSDRPRLGILLLDGSRVKTASQNRQRGPRKCPKGLYCPLRTRRPRCGDTAAIALPASWTPRGGAMPRRPIAPTDPRAAGDGVSSRVSSTAARLARMAATALSIAASSGGRAARCCRSASNQSGHAAGRKTAIGNAPLRATPVRFSHTHTKTPDGG